MFGDAGVAVFDIVAYLLEFDCDVVTRGNLEVFSVKTARNQAKPPYPKRSTRYPDKCVISYRQSTESCTPRERLAGQGVLS